MSSLSLKMTATASRLINKYGAAITITRTIPGTFSAATQTQTTPTTTSDTLKGTIEEYKAHEIDGESIRYGDKKILVPKSDLQNLLEPKPGDIISIDSKTYRVVSHEGLSAGDSFAGFYIQARR